MSEIGRLDTRLPALAVGGHRPRRGIALGAICDGSVALVR
jgi:hypothetical protein